MSVKETATAQHSGNTSPECCKKRCFQLTLNCEEFDVDKSHKILLEKYDRLISYLKSLKYSYILSCKELNKKGYYHIHIFIQFDTPHKLSTNKLEGAHIEICRGSVNQNINYLRKEGYILEECGTPKYILGNPKIKDIALSSRNELIEAGDYRFYNVIKKIKSDNQPLFNTPKNIIFYNTLDDIPYNKNNYQFLEIKNGKIKNCYQNIIITENQLNTSICDFIFNKFNKHNNHFYPADIENIIIITDYHPLQEHILKKYNNLIKKI